MRQTQRRRLAVNAMIDIAQHEQARPVALAAIAHRQRAGLFCLGQLCARLRAAGLLKVSRGAGGGFTLGREAAVISVADIIIDAVDAGSACADSGDQGSSLVDDLAQRLEAAMQIHMAAIALIDLVAGLHDASSVVEAPRRRAALAAQAWFMQTERGLANLDETLDAASGQHLILSSVNFGR